MEIPETEEQRLRKIDYMMGFNNFRWLMEEAHIQIESLQSMKYYPPGVKLIDLLEEKVRYVIQTAEVLNSVNNNKEESSSS